MIAAAVVHDKTKTTNATNAELGKFVDQGELVERAYTTAGSIGYCANGFSLEELLLISILLLASAARTHTPSSHNISCSPPFSTISTNDHMASIAPFTTEYKQILTLVF